MTKPVNETNRNELFIIERKRHGWTQHDVAEKIAAQLSPLDIVDVRTVKRWESGESKPSGHHLKLLEELFQKSGRELGFVDEGKIPFWNVSQYYQRNPFFTGRGNVLTQLRDLLLIQTSPDSPRPVALTGLPGVGKTQIAVEYCYQYKHEYHTIVWLSADTEAILASRFATIARLLNLPQKEEQNQNQITETVKEWFSGAKKWLLIFDNIDDLEMIHNFIPSPCHGHIILTTRFQATGRLAQNINVDTWTLQEGARFLLIRAKIPSPSQEDYKKAEEVSHALNGLPLALNQAGTYIEGAESSLAEYTILYQAQGKKLRLWNGPYQKKEYPHSVATAFSLTFEKVRNAHPNAFELLQFFAFLHPESIPEEIISKEAINSRYALQNLVNDPVALDDAIAELRKSSLIRRNPATKICALHRLVQDVILDNMDEDTKRFWAEFAVRTVSHLFPDGRFEQWSSCHRLLSQAQICVIHITQWNMVFAESAQLLDHLGTYFCLHAQYVDAEKLYTKALAQREQLYGQNHPDIAQSCSNLGFNYYLQYRDDLSIEFYQRALQINESIFGLSHSSIVPILHRISDFYESKKDLNQAEQFLVRAQTILEQTSEEKDIQWTKITSSLGIVHYKQGRYEEAEQTLKASLQMGLKLKDPKHPDIAVDHRYLGQLYHDQRKYKEAEYHFKQALQIRKQSLGLSDPAVADSLYCLAKHYQDQELYKKAERLYKQAFIIIKRTLGAEHPFIAEISTDYIKLLRATNKISEAIKLEERIRLIQLKQEKVH